MFWISDRTLKKVRCKAQTARKLFVVKSRKKRVTKSLAYFSPKCPFLLATSKISNLIMRISVGKVFWHHEKNYISKGANFIGSVPSLACICRHFRSRFTTAFGPTGTCVTHRVSYESSNHNRSQSLVETGDAFFLHLKTKELSSRLCSETTLNWICWWALIMTFECIRFGDWARLGLRRERKMVAGDRTKGMKTKAQLIKLLPIHTIKEGKTFCNSDCRRSSHRPWSHVKRGLGN